MLTISKPLPETTQRWIVAKFHHDTARPDQKEQYVAPQLHTHSVVFNMTRTENRDIRSLDAIELFRSQQFGSAVYQAELGKRLRELGYQVHVGKNGAPEIAGYSPEFLHANSVRASGETVYQIKPDGPPVLIDDGFWSSESARSAESLAEAEDRLAKFGFEKIVEGSAVSFQLRHGSTVIFADPRCKGKIEICGYRLEPSKRKKGKPLWRMVGNRMNIFDSWWRSDPTGRFRAFLTKNFPPAQVSA